MNRFFFLMTHPRAAVNGLLVHFGRGWTDERYLFLSYLINFGKKPNFKEPRTFNEKMNWLKLHDQKDIYTTMADKYAAKAFVAELIGGKYIVRNYGVYNRWEDIDFSSLPDKFVIKGTHDSGGAFVCKDKKSFDFKKVERRIKHNLKINYFYPMREWPYKNIKPRIIVDQLLDDGSGHELRDYKFWCFNGKPVYMYVTNKGKVIKENFYDMDFKSVTIDHGFDRTIPEYVIPAEFELMKSLAAKLCAGIPFVRVDFFDVNGKVYFGEFTFFDWGGMRPFRDDWDLKLGSLLVLPDKKRI